jgi:hypothetical protein
MFHFTKIHEDFRLSVPSVPLPTLIPHWNDKEASDPFASARPHGITRSELWSQRGFPMICASSPVRVAVQCPRDCRAITRDRSAGREARERTAILRLPSKAQVLTADAPWSRPVISSIMVYSPRVRGPVKRTGPCMAGRWTPDETGGSDGAGRDHPTSKW